jgi:hypothetical protein
VKSKIGLLSIALILSGCVAIPVNQYDVIDYVAPIYRPMPIYQAIPQPIPIPVYRPMPQPIFINPRPYYRYYRRGYR